MSAVRNLLSLFVLLFGLCNGASAQVYPDRPIRIVVPFPPGAVTDVVARLTADFIRAKTNQTVIVMNSAGAAGNIGTRAVSNSAPDGYTLALIANSIMAINPHIYKDMKFNSLVDLEPVATIVDVPAMLVTNESAPYNDLPEFISHAKNKPGSLSYGSSGFGSPLHLGLHRLAYAAQIDLVHVPYKGAAPAIQDLVAGRIHVMALGYGTVAGLVNGGKLKFLATATRTRLKVLPQVKTVEETLGSPFEHSAWFGLAAPKATPTSVIKTLNELVGQMLVDPSISSKFRAIHMIPMPSTPGQMRNLIRREYDRWEDLIRVTKLLKP